MMPFCISPERTSRALACSVVAAEFVQWLLLRSGRRNMHRSDAGKRAPTAVACFYLSRRRHLMLDLVSRVLKSVMNGGSQNWIETTNSAEQGRQQNLEREHIRAERFKLFVGDCKFSVDGGLAKHGLICISTFYFCSSWTVVYWHSCPLRTHTQQNSVVS